MNLKKVCSALSITCLLLSVSAFAQNRPPRFESALEQRVSNLEYQLGQTNRRLLELEKLLSTPQPPVYEQRTDVSCLYVDTGHSKTFLSQGRTKLEAEANVRQVCGQSVHSSLCTGTSLKCSSGVKEHGVRGYLCIITDSGHGKTFKGDGVNEVEAEAKARQSCQSTVHPSLCGKVTARCDSY